MRIAPDHGFARWDLPFWFAVIGLEKEALAVSEDARPQVLSLLGKPRQAVAAAQADFANDPVDMVNRDELGMALASDGDCVQARPYLEESLWRYGGETMGSAFSANQAAVLIAARRAAGEEDSVAELLAAIREKVRRYREAGVAPDWCYMASKGSSDYSSMITQFMKTFPCHRPAHGDRMDSSQVIYPLNG
jgi:hypothetical protein